MILMNDPASCAVCHLRSITPKPAAKTSCSSHRTPMFSSSIGRCSQLRAATTPVFGVTALRISSFCYVSAYIRAIFPYPRTRKRISMDHCGDEFFAARPYSGFRRLFELMSQPSEGLGLKVFHLYHHREQGHDWYRNNDWKREKFAASTGRYLECTPRTPVGRLPQPTKKIACLCKNTDMWGYFTPAKTCRVRDRSGL